MKKFLLYLFLCFPYMVVAQNALPDTDIFLLDVKKDKNGKYNFSNLKNITARPGYDNQPSFLNNDTILFTSIREKQADVYLYSLVTGKTIQLTNTPEDEYSPTLMPGIDSFEFFIDDSPKQVFMKSRYVSVVRVEKDSTQRLWKFPLKSPTDFSLILPDVKGVGYHAWVNDSLVALFMLGEPFTLQLANLKSQTNPEIIDSVIGRSIQYNKDETIYYISKKDSNSWKILSKHIALFLKQNTHIIDGIVYDIGKISEDFVIGPDGAFWIGSGSKLLRFDPYKDKTWQEVYDLKGTPAENFYRLAFSPDGKKLALVSYIGKKP